MGLDRVIRGRQPRPRRLCVYGVHGVGKSSLGASAPKPIFIQTEDGLGDVDCDKFPLATSFEDVMDAITELYEDASHCYSSVVLDSLDWAERLIHPVVCRDRGVENIEDIGFAKGYVYALDRWREILDGLDALRLERGMTVILLAHAKVEKFANPETESYDRMVPRLNKHASALIQEWCDEVLFATYRVHVKQTDEGFGRKGTKGIGSGERVLRTTERPAHAAKNRLGLPDELPLSWDAYAEYLPPAAHVPVAESPAA